MTGFNLRIWLFCLTALSVFCTPEIQARTVVSVLGFQNTAKNRQVRWLSRGLSDMLTTGLSQSPEVTLVEREDLNKVLAEHKLALAGLVDDQSAVSLGKLLNAKYLVTGSYIQMGNSLRVDAKVIQTETAQVQSVQSTFALPGLFPAVEDLSRQVLFRIILKESPRIVIQTNVLDAVRYYYEGLDDLELSNTAGAIDKFRLASIADPLYSRPQKGLEEAYQFLRDFRQLRQQRELLALFDKLDRFRRKTDEKPFRTYLEILTNANLSALSPAERERFNRDNEVNILCSTPAHCAWNQELVLLEIFNKKRTVQDERWDEMENRFREKERKARETRETEKKPLRDRKFDLLTNDLYKSWSREDLQRERDAVNKKTEELETRHDAEEKIFEDEEAALERDRRRADGDRFRSDSAYLKEIVRIAERARKDFVKDRFLPDILYLELLAWRELKDFQSLKNYSESFLMNYPDYRMVDAVEDFYKSALDELKK